MDMNRKGQTMILSLMLVVIAFVTMVILTQPIKEFTDIARDSSHLDCSNTSISTGTRLTCLVVDLYLFYFVGAVLAASVGLLFYKYVTD